MKRRKQDPDSLLDTAAASLKARRFDEAAALCRKVMARHPGHPRACHLIAVVCLFRNDPHSAVDWLQQAIAGDPARVAFYGDLGVALSATGRHDEAVAAFRRALRSQPHLAPIQFRLAQSLRALERHREAMDALILGLEASPMTTEGWRNLGEVCVALSRFDDAAKAFGRAAELDPGNARHHALLGVALVNQNRTDEAIASFERALALRPDDHGARRSRCLAHLQIVYRDEAEIDHRRSSYRQAVADLVRHYEGAAPSELAAAVGAVTDMQPYYLPYQGRNDRDVQSRLGDLTGRIMAAALPQWRQRSGSRRVRAAKRGDDRLRIGLVSGFFRDHSVWKIPTRGWVTQLDRKRFAVFGYYTRVTSDDCTAEAAAACHRFVQGNKPVGEWATIIAGDEPDALIYPEIGMDPACAALAALRLAPLQCNSLAHPVTSGYPTLDVCLSSALMEPADAQEYYRERLLALPNIGCHYQPVDPAYEPIRREAFGARPEAVVYWSCQNLAKYLPRYDDVFPRIARELQDCQFVFIRNPSDVVTDAFRRRMEVAFARHGLPAERHCLFVARMSTRAFAATGAACDVFLDSLGWSGFNTAMESLAVGLPVVTCPGPMMRARHAAAVLGMIGVTDTVAATVDDFVGLAVRLGQDRAWRAEIAGRMAARRHLAYGDRACVTALENFLMQTAAVS